MEESKKNEAARGSWFKGLQAEFHKIKWLSKESLGKQTVAVIIVSVILGIIIAVLDLLIQNGIDLLVNL
ncbi:MAG: preprotein translocase subunit SecE [Clostridiales bacterium]|nr:preprotein translocase subunit SecE [Clostridiales bacterium]